MNSFYQAVSGGVSVARLVYSQARMIGNGADDPGFFVSVWFFLKFYFYRCSRKSSYLYRAEKEGGIFAV